MTTVNNLLKKFQNLNPDQLITDSVVETKEVYGDLQVEQQLQGLKADGNEMPDYSATSVDLFGKEPGPIKLRDTGAFQTAIEVKVDASVIVARSNDSKNDMMVKRYGKEIFGLSDKFKQEFRQQLEPVVINNFRKNLNL